MPPMSLSAPDDLRGEHRWYWASPTGGLWIGGAPPDGGEDQAPTLPLNDQARAESDIGIDVAADAPVFDGADPDSEAAQRALACAAQ